MKTLILLILSLAAYGQQTINAPAVTLSANGLTAVLEEMARTPKGTQPNTTLTALINTTDTTLQVADGAGLNAGSVLAINSSEHVTVTARTGKTLTVTRGTNGSTAASAAEGATVYEMKDKTINAYGKSLMVLWINTITRRSAAVRAGIVAAEASADAAAGGAAQ